MVKWTDGWCRRWWDTLVLRTWPSLCRYGTGESCWEFLRYARLLALLRDYLSVFDRVDRSFLLWLLVQCIGVVKRLSSFTWGHYICAFFTGDSTQTENSPLSTILPSLIAWVLHFFVAVFFCFLFFCHIVVNKVLHIAPRWSSKLVVTLKLRCYVISTKHLICLYNIRSMNYASSRKNAV